MADTGAGTHATVGSGLNPSPALLVGALGVFVVGLVARLVPLLRGGGLTGFNRYDDGVNFSGALGLVHGRLPYRDFLWLHPPGMQLALAPFAASSYLIGEPAAFVVARLGWIVVGSLTAVLVGRLLLPAGWFAGLFGGMLCALFWPAVVSTQTVRLEGVASLLLVIALLLLTAEPPRGRVTTRAVVFAGALLGFCATVKIWGVVTVLVLVAWLCVRDGLRRAALLLGSAVAATIVICLPFFILAPEAMWRMVVTDQIGRPRGVDTGHRLAQITGVSAIAPGWSLVLGLALGALGLCTVLAWGLRRARPAVLLLLAFTVVLVASPLWFFHYSGLSAPVLSIVCGAGLQRLADLPPLRSRTGLRRGLIGAALAALALPAAFAAINSEGQRFPARDFGAALAGSQECVTADDPSALILTDSVGRNIRRGCPLVIDLGGYSHDLGRTDEARRRANDAFQALALSYLGSGDRAILTRFTTDDGWSKATDRAIRRWPAVAQSGQQSVRVPR